jgi:hypothetical protein
MNGQQRILILLETSFKLKFNKHSAQNCRWSPNWTVHNSRSSRWNPVCWFSWKDLSEDVPLSVCKCMWFQHNDTSPLFSYQVHNNHWTSAEQPFSRQMDWPWRTKSGLCILLICTHLIFSYGDASKKTDMLWKYNMVMTWSLALNIRGQPWQLVHARDSIHCHCEACGRAGGGNIEQILWRNTQNCESPCYTIRHLCWNS